MTANELRQKYLDFFKAKGHAIIPSASLIPENDPSVLFTTAGMHPLVPFLMGEKHPAGQKLASCQKCVRTSDIDQVGDDCHLTFFEMLGNWSLGDPARHASQGDAGGYWKEEAIKWSWEFLTGKKWLGLDPDKIAISVFGGDQDCPDDEESYHLWKSLGIAEERIVRLDKNENWWPAGGNSVGPQGPDTEMFYWTGPETAPEAFDPKDTRWFEIWNDVFMQFNRTSQGKYEQLKQKNVDTGFGLERALTAINGLKSVYETELFLPVIDQIKKQAKDYDETSARIIADHLKAAIFIMSEEAGVIPSNVSQGYVVRKLVRRAVRHTKKIGIPLKKDLTTPIVELVVGQYQDIYQELKKNQQRIIDELNKEEAAFEKTLEKGLKEFNNFVLSRKNYKKTGRIGVAWDQRYLFGSDAFYLYETFGFPREMMEELCKENGIDFDSEGFEEEMKKHQDLSRTASAGQFKGGLADHSEIVTKYHTATHLLQQALRDVLGSHVQQKGSNITEQRLRFDFSHPVKMTDQQIRDVEDIVNCKINEDLPVSFSEMTVAEAKKQGARGLFTEKYGEKVKVYSIGPSTGSGQAFSREICGGPHVAHTGELGHFKIIKEEASSAGVRRIKAVLE